MNGYHEFYRATNLHKGIPLHTVSLWNTVILAIQTIMQHTKYFDEHCTKGPLTPTVCIVLFSALETVLLVGVHGWYITRVMRFNRATLPPDAYRGLTESASSVSDGLFSAIGDLISLYSQMTFFSFFSFFFNVFNIFIFYRHQVGVSTRDAEAHDLLEKQADLINYLKDHNNKLNQKLMTLNAQIRASSGNINGNN